MCIMTLKWILTTPIAETPMTMSDVHVLVNMIIQRSRAVVKIWEEVGWWSTKTSPLFNYLRIDSLRRYVKGSNGLSNKCLVISYNSSIYDKLIFTKRTIDLSNSKLTTLQYLLQITCIMYMYLYLFYQIEITTNRSQHVISHCSYNCFIICLHSYILICFVFVICAKNE